MQEIINKLDKYSQHKTWLKLKRDNPNHREWRDSLNKTFIKPLIQELRGYDKESLPRKIFYLSNKFKAQKVGVI